MKKQGCVILLLTIACVVLVTGCGKKKDKKTTTTEEKITATFTVAQDNSFEVVYEEDFKEDYYNKDELDSMVDRELQEFNNNYGTGVIKSGLEIKDGRAKLILKFPDYASYVSYASEYVSSSRNARLFIGSYDEAVAAGYNFAGTYTGKDGKTEFSFDDILGSPGIYVLFTNEGFQISVDGEILGISSGVTVKDGIAVTSDKRENYVIYKKNL